MSSIITTTITKFDDQDLLNLYELNQSEDPHVGSVEPLTFRKLIFDWADTTLVVRDNNGQALGFIMAMNEDSTYQSLNYLWFKKNCQSFLYVDRIAVHKRARGLGVGKALYQRIFDLARDTGLGLVTCEVNLNPPNPLSLAFHSKLGFRPMGEQDTDGGTKRVVLLGKNLLESTT